MNAIEICNLALDHIGQSPITSFDEGSTQASACERQYQPALLGELRAFDWGFARGYISAALMETLTADAIAGWSYRYAYPAGIERIWGVLEDPRATPREKFRVGTLPGGERIIYCNVAPAWFRVTRSITDPTFFPSDFVMALSFLLASRIAMPITRDMKTTSNMLTLYKQAIAEARMSAANEDGPDTTADVSAPGQLAAWTAARGEVG